MFAIERQRTRLRAECMAREGFPESQQVIDPDRDGGSSFQYDLRQFGPMTVDQAQEFGMNGAAWRTVDVPGTQVFSNDPATDRAGKKCEEKIADATGNVTELLFTYNDFENQLQARFLAALENDGGDVKAYTVMIDCLNANGWPQVDATSVLGEAGWSALGVKLGTFPEPPDPSEAPNTTKVLKVPDQTYRPSEDEIRLAKDFVDCRKSTNFDDILIRTFNAAQQQALAGQEPQIEEYRAQLDDLLTRIQGADLPA